MKAVLIACASLTLTLGAACSSEHTGIPATPTIDPIGTEPTDTDDGGGSVGGVYGLFCRQSCDNTARACGTNFNNYCEQSCVYNLQNYRGCEAEQLAYLACMGTANINCSFGYPRAPECDPAQLAVGECRSRPPPLPEQ